MCEKNSLKMTNIIFFKSIIFRTIIYYFPKKKNYYLLSYILMLSHDKMRSLIY